MNEDNPVFAKCAWRLMPFVGLIYLVSFIDRVNVAFAALTMNRDLGFTPIVYGFGAGVFFIGFFLFQVPTTVILERVGAKRTVFCIMAAWGLISAAHVFVQDPASFYVLRFFLGIAEAGIFPGLIFYLTLWFPKAYRARLIAALQTAPPLAFIIGGPLSGIILGMDGLAGLEGWQWLFLLEGLPAFFLSFAVLKLLPDNPSRASWLTAAEKRTIAARLSSEDTAEHRDLFRALIDARVLGLGLVMLGILFAAYGIDLWLPQIVQAMGFSNFETGFVVAAPHVVSMALMIFWSYSSDVRGERIWHVAIPALLAAAGFAVAGITASYALALLALTFALIGIRACYGPFFSLPAAFLGGQAAAGGIAMIYAIGSLGGFLGPTVFGVVKQQTGSYAPAMAALAVGLALAAALVLAMGRSKRLALVA